LAVVVEILAAWRTCYPGLHHSFSITGGEPLLYHEVLVEWLPVLRRLRPIYLETNGTLPGSLAAVIDQLDYISMDIKLPSASGCAPLWDTHRKFLEVAVQKEVFVKIIVAPDTTAEEIDMVCMTIRDVDPSISLILQPVTRRGKAAVPANLLLKFQEQAARLLGDVRVIPQTHVFLNLL